MKRNYDECVTKYSDSFVRVVLDPGYVSRIQNFVTELVEAKSKEDHHKPPYPHGANSRGPPV